jgi:hypothetical protein
MRDNIVVNEDVTIIRTTNYYDGILSGICSYRGQECYFNIVKEPWYVYRLHNHEIEECKEHFATRVPPIPWVDDYATEYVYYRIYNIYPCKESTEVLGTFELYNNTEELIAEGYTLICTSGDEQ